MTIPGLGDALLNSASDAIVATNRDGHIMSGIPARSGYSASPLRRVPVSRST
jgi:hypothetical protein